MDLFELSVAIFLLCGYSNSDAVVTIVEKRVAIVQENTIIKNKRDIEPLPHYLPLEINAGKDINFQITLQKRTEISPSDIKVTFEDPKLDNIKYRTLENVAFYHSPVYQAVISVTSDPKHSTYKRTLTGTFIYDDKAYEISPAIKEIDNLDKILSEKGIDPEEDHKIHMIKQVSLPDLDSKVNYKERMKKGYPHKEYDDISDDDDDTIVTDRFSDQETYFNFTESSNSKRLINVQQTDYHIEIIFLLDYSVFYYWITEHQGNHEKAVYDITFFFSHIFHGIYMAYQSISFEKYKVTITPWLKEIIVTTTPLQSWFTERAKISDSRIDLDRSEDNLRTYMNQKEYTWANPDHLMVWSRYTFELGGKSGLLGLAGEICSICKSGKGLSQDHEYGLFSWSTGAHELAHTLGALHDDATFKSGCRPTDKYLMTPFSAQWELPTYKNSFTFSKCSVEMMKRCFKGIRYGGISPSFPRTCVFDTVCKNGHSVKNNLSQLPGQKYTLKEQCQLSIGNLAAKYSSRCNNGNICLKMQCDLNGVCTDNGNQELRAVAGTPCDTLHPNKVCYKGECVDSSVIKYNQVSGGGSCSIVRRIPKRCSDTPNYIYGNDLACVDVVKRTPWKCYYNPDIKQNCKRSCFDWGLIRKNAPLCPFNEVRIRVQSSNENNASSSGTGSYYVNNLGFTYCGYVSGSWHVRCPNLPTKCIPMRYVCDNVEDCPNGADENTTFCSQVPSGYNVTASVYVRCPGDPFTLIPKSSLCNGHPDCPDGLDEVPANCSPIRYCNDNGKEVTCPNNPRQCIPVVFTCNGVDDCGHGQQAGDESQDFCHTLCPLGEIRCPNLKSGLQCIRGQWACDNSNDCGNNEDENKTWCDSLKTITPITCQEGMKTCPDAPYICVPLTYNCNSTNDCPQGSVGNNCKVIREMTIIDKIKYIINSLEQDSERNKLKTGFKHTKGNVLASKQRKISLIEEEKNIKNLGKN